MAKRTRRAGAGTGVSLEFSSANWVLLAAGLVSVALGYVFLARGSTVAAPLLLVLGYVILIPLAIVE
ncbi:MAG: hypothetical protein ACRELV_04285 [Longimicrobiales bacterium]